MTVPFHSDKHRYVGASTERPDALDKVTGAAVYVQDMALPGMLVGRMVTSPHAHARIVRVETARAEAVPGVRAVLTGEELDVKLGLYMIDRPILARGVARYHGEPVAAVCADTDDAALRACELIEVVYEELPAVLDPELALADGAQLVHPDLHLYGYMKGVFTPRPHSNVAHHQKIRKGDVAKGFADSAHVFEHAFSNPPVAHAPLETHAVIAHALPGRRMHVITSAQSPFTVRNLMAVAFGLPHNAIRVQIPYVGGGFGGKAGVHLEPLAYCLSRKAGGRPVKLATTREQELNTLPSRQGLRTRIKTGVSREGKILAFEAKYIWDAGAYADYGVNIGRAAATGSAGPYEIPNCTVDSLVVYTNKVFGTAFRGFGHLEVLWGVERNMDLIAHTLGIDPFELRQRNVLRAGATTITGEKVTPNHGRPDVCLEKVAAAIGYVDRPRRSAGDKRALRGKVRGKGIALLHKAPAMPVFTCCSAIVKFNEDASVNVLVSGVDYGQGTYAALRQIAAEELSIPVDKVQVVWDCDTATQPYDWQTVASRFAVMGGNAVIEAARDCIAQIKGVAAQVLRAPDGELVCEDEKVFVRHTPDQMLTYRQVVLGYTYPNGNSIGGPILGRGRYIAQGLTHLHPETGQGKAALDWTYGAHGVEIEVDTDTGDLEIVRIASAFDVGRVLHEGMCTTQVQGGVLQGIGSALLEGLRFDERGRMLNGSFVDYKIPTAKDLPRSAARFFVETPQLDGPHGARGVGEHPMVSIPSAVGNALRDALGIDLHDLPLTPERVYLAIKRAREAAGPPPGEPGHGAERAPREG
jgi:CO/xanthine dehydrogenase Mo-binding subunit